MKLDMLYKDGAVLQRNSPILVSGEGAGKLGISFLGYSYTFDITDEKWSVTLPELDACGPFKMSFSLDGEEYSIEDIYAGDVYLCAGQSNMEIILEKCYCDRSALKEDTLLRCLELQTTTTEYKWAPATPESVLKMTAVGYYFAEHARSEGVAVGIISCNRGATSAESWIDRDLLIKHGLFIPDEEKAERGLLFYPYNKCGELHSLLFDKIGKYSMRACVYYQGESNASHPHSPSYTELMCLLIDSWREELGCPALPFVMTELCDFGEYSNGKINFAEVREHQRKAVQRKRGEGVYYITTTDLGEVWDIHPRRKKQIAERLWNAVRCEVFGQKCEYSGPFAERAELDGNTARIYFSHSAQMRAEGKVRTLTAQDKDGSELKILSAELVDDRIEIKAEGVIAHISLFYRNNPMTNIFNGAGLPATGFRC